MKGNMEIKPLSDSLNYLRDASVKKKPVKEEIARDRIELSSEATRKMENESASKTKRIEEIQKKIENKFYNSDEVISKVAQKILDEISR